MQSDERLWASPLVSSLWLDLGPESLAVIVDFPPGWRQTSLLSGVEGVSHSRSL